jgi:hypothetical protein
MDEELDAEGNPAGYSLILDEIHATLVYYLNSCNEIWSPILSTWSLQLLGQISTESSNRAVITRAQSVNEVIKIWVGSKAIQSLLDIISKCLRTVNQTSTNAFIAALLGKFLPNISCQILNEILKIACLFCRYERLSRYTI